MSRRWARVALVGPGLEPSELRDHFRPPPRPEYEEDDPGRHRTTGQDWRIGASELDAAVKDVRADLEPVDAPPEFSWLDLGTLQGIVHRLSLNPPGPDAPDIAHRYRANGTFIPGDDIWDDHAADLVNGSFIEIVPAKLPEPPGPVYAPHTPNSELRRAEANESRELQVANARELACWMVGGFEPWRGGRLQRCWRVGTPWPGPLDGTIEPRSLPPAVVRRIIRAVRDGVEHPGPLVTDRPWLIFDVSEEGAGECSGSWYPQSERFWGRPREHYLKVRLPMAPDGRPDDDPERIEELEALLSRVTVAADGRVIYPPADALSGSTDAF